MNRRLHPDHLVLGSLASHPCGPLADALYNLDVITIDAVAKLLAEDIRVEDRRSEQHRHFATDGYQYESLLGAVGKDSLALYDLNVLALRDNGSALTRIRVEMPRRPPVDLLLVAQVNHSSQVDRLVLFDLADFAAANTELAAQYCQTLDPERLQVYETAHDFGIALLERSHDDLAQLLSEDFVMLDHRTAEPRGPIDTDAALHYVANVLDEEPELVDSAPEVHLLNESVIVTSRATMHVDRPQVGETDISLVAVRDQRIQTLELYDSHDVEKALQAARSWGGGTRDTP